MLNLFGYTGAASLLAAAAGAEVTHVDASKKAIQWAKENQAASKLEAAPIRWILDDAAKFVAREVRRGRTYHVILVDPPKFGRGPEGEVWDLFAGLPGAAAATARSCWRRRSASLVLTVYAIRASALAFDQLCATCLRDRGGSFSIGRARHPRRGRRHALCRPRSSRGGPRHECASPRTITSLTNDRVKAIRALDMSKERKETGLFVAEGASILVTARDAGFVPETLVYQAGAAAGGVARELVQWALARRRGSARGLGGRARQARLEGKPADACSACSASAGPSCRRRPGIAPDAAWLALEEVRDPGNLGTIMRTVDAVGAAGVILIGKCCDPYSREAVRATMGSIFAVPLVRMSREDVPRLARRLAGRRRRHASWPRSEDFRKAATGEPVLLVMGSEGPGLSESLTRSLHAARQDPDGGQARQPQPRRRDRAHALSAPRPAPEAVVARFADADALRS